MRPQAMRYARNGLEPVLVLVVVAVLHRLEVFGPAPMWLVALPLLAGMLYQQPDVQLRLAGGDLRRRVWPRVLVHMSLVSWFMYLIEWGPVLAVAHFHILAMHLRWSGARAWLPAAVGSAGSIVAGEAAVWAGLVGSYLPQPQVHGVAVLVAVGTVTTCRVFGRTVHRQEVAELAVRRSEERFRALVHDGSDMIVVAEADGAVTYVSPAAVKVTGLPPEELLGTGILERIHPDDAGRVEALHRRVLAGDESAEHQAELRFRTADGQWRWLEVTARNMLTDPAVGGIVAHHRDITERRAHSERMAYDASHDALTGLLNPAAFGAAVQRALNGPDLVALLYLDLDGFKPVNDTFGHAVGDHVLHTVSALIRGQGDAVGRLGGDEFGVLLTGLPPGSERDTARIAGTVAERIVAAVGAAVLVDGHEIRIGCSVGVAVGVPGAGDVEGLMRAADAAMYRAKRRGRNRIEVHVS